MKRASQVARAGQWSAADAIDRVALDAHERHRRRIVLTAEGGTGFLLDLPQATALHDGDGLVLDGGATIAVVAKPEPLVEIAAQDAAALARLAWHLGNRHTEVQVVGERLRIRRDRVLEDMLSGLGARLTPVEAPFEPERGAYEHEQIATPIPERAERSESRGKVRLPCCEAGATSELAHPALYRLMTWMSPAYPVGAFSYSGGIEWAVEAGDIRSAETLRGWLTTMIYRGALFCDAAIFAHAHRTAAAGDDRALAAVAELAVALAGSKERFLETTVQGQAFLQITRTTWPTQGLDRLAAARGAPLTYPVVVAAACAGHGIALGPSLHAFLHGVVSNLVSAGVRLVPLGQTDGQRVLAALEAPIAQTAERAPITAFDDIGVATPRADIAGMRHETQYTRLFRS